MPNDDVVSSMTEEPLDVDGTCGTLDKDDAVIRMIVPGYTQEPFFCCGNIYVFVYCLEFVVHHVERADILMYVSADEVHGFSPWVLSTYKVRNLVLTQTFVHLLYLRVSANLHGISWYLILCQKNIKRF